MKRMAIITAGCLLALCMAACIQSGVAALVTTLGNASSGIAALEGNSTLAATLQTDTAAVSTAVLNWKQGSPTQNVIQALNLVEADLDLIPSTDKYAPLVDLAIGTVESIMEIVQPNSTAVQARAGITHRVYLKSPPKSAGQFKKEWNSLAPAEAKIQ
jgi:hypothetical protein